MLKRTWKIALLTTAMAAALTAMVALVGPAQTLATLRQTGPAAFASVGALLAGTVVLQALAWAMLNRVVGLRVGVLTSLEASVIGLAGNILTPSTYLGGEPAKIFFAGRRGGASYEALAGTVLLAKYLEAISFVLFVSVGALVTSIGLADVLFAPSHRAWGLTLVAVGVAAAVMTGVLILSLLARGTPLAGLVRLLARLGLFRRRLEGLARRAVKVELRVSRVFRQEGRAIWPAFGLFGLTHVLMFVKPLAFFGLGWGVALSLPELGLFFLTSQVLLAFQLTPSGVGTLDGGLFAMLALAGMAIAAPQMAVFLLCVRFWDAAVVAVGAVLAGRVGAGLLTGQKEPAPAPARVERRRELAGVAVEATSLTPREP